MASFKFFCLFAFGLSTFGVTNIDAKCNQCSPITYAACLNETAFTVCYDGATKSETIEVCPKDRVCTAQQGVCKPRASEAPDCGVCNLCFSGFACISKTQFKYCNGATLTEIVGTCPKEEYCSLENLIQKRRICVKSCLLEPTCYAEEILLPEPTPAPDYSSICIGTTEKGNFENIYDPTCKSFIYCEKLGSDMNSILINCAEGTYFSASERKCVAKKPSGCT